MHQRKSKKVLIYFFLLIIVSSIGNNSINNFKFNQNFNEIDFDFRNSFKIKERDLFDKIFNTVIGELFPKN